MISIQYKTAEGREYPLELNYQLISVNDICYEPDYIRNLCKIGCSNYDRSGGCPPRSPLFPTIVEKTQHLVLIVCRFDSIHKPDTVKNSKNTAIHWKFQDGILARVLNKLGHTITKSLGGIFLATGYCMGCPGKKCTYKLGLEQCRNPHLRTFSMEATGINVVNTVEKKFNVPMYWYRKGNIEVPYMLKCILVKPENEIEQSEINQIVIDSLNNLGLITPEKNN